MSAVPWVFTQLCLLLSFCLDSVLPNGLLNNKMFFSKFNWCFKPLSQLPFRVGTGCLQVKVVKPVWAHRWPAQWTCGVKMFLQVFLRSSWGRQVVVNTMQRSSVKKGGSRWDLDVSYWLSFSSIRLSLSTAQGTISAVHVISVRSLQVAGLLEMTLLSTTLYGAWPPNECVT